MRRIIWTMVGPSLDPEGLSVIDDGAAIGPHLPVRVRPAFLWLWSIYVGLGPAGAPAAVRTP